MSLLRRALAEALGTAFLLAAIVGSGIMAERLAQGNEAIALLANSLATGGAFIAPNPDKSQTLRVRGRGLHLAVPLNQYATGVSPGSGCQSMVPRSRPPAAVPSHTIRPSVGLRVSAVKCVTPFCLEAV